MAYFGATFLANMVGGGGQNFKVVKTVFLENGVFVPYRKQVVLTKNGENDELHKNKGLRPSEPGNRRKLGEWRVSLRQNHRLPKTPFFATLRIISDCALSVPMHRGR